MKQDRAAGGQDLGIGRTLGTNLMHQTIKYLMHKNLTVKNDEKAL